MMESTRKILAQNLKNLRNSKGLTQFELAELADISATFLQKIEYGKKWPSPETIDRLARALKVAATELTPPPPGPQILSDNGMDLIETMERMKTLLDKAKQEKKLIEVLPQEEAELLA